MDTYGSKADTDDDLTPDEIIDRDMARPEFLSYSTYKEIRNLLFVVSNDPDLRHLKTLVDCMVLMMDHVDRSIQEACSQ